MTESRIASPLPTIAISMVGQELFVFTAPPAVQVQRSFVMSVARSVHGGTGEEIGALGGWMQTEKEEQRA